MRERIGGRRWGAGGRGARGRASWALACVAPVLALGALACGGSGSDGGSGADAGLSDAAHPDGAGAHDGGSTGPTGGADAGGGAADAGPGPDAGTPRACEAIAAGMPGACCASPCECTQGFDCVNGTCAGTASDVFCCTRGGCPPGRACAMAGGGQGTCPGVCTDADHDGYGEGADCAGPDCDDTDAARHPLAVELCNARDDDCDGETDEPAPGDPACPVDNDRDGFSAPEDCNDLDPTIFPAAGEDCDSRDRDCDGDGDDVPGGCDPSVARPVAIFPGMAVDLPATGGGTHRLAVGSTRADGRMAVGAGADFATGVFYFDEDFSLFYADVLFDQELDDADTLWFILLGPRFLGRTAEGLGTGSTRAAVEAAYGAPDAVLTRPEGREAWYYERGVAFRYDAEDHVDGITVAPPQSPKPTSEVGPSAIAGLRTAFFTGSTIAEVRRVLGPPAGQRFDLADEGLGLYTAFALYPGLGLTVSAASLMDDFESAWTLMIRVDYPWAGRTRGGNGLGSTRAELEAELGAPAGSGDFAGIPIVYYGRGPGYLGVYFDDRGTPYPLDDRALSLFVGFTPGQ